MSGTAAAIDLYDQNPELFGARYAKGRFEDIHGHVLNHLPPIGASVLDVGAGVGRDAVALAACGYRVTAVEPSVALQNWSCGHYGKSDVEWIADRLPRLASLDGRAASFDFILCSAVLVHIPVIGLQECFGTFARLMTNRGKVTASIRHAISSDLPEVFFDHADAAIIHAAETAAFTLLERVEGADTIGRPDVMWRSLVFGRARGGADAG